MNSLNFTKTAGNPTTTEDENMADSNSPSPRVDPTFTSASASETQTETSRLLVSIASNWAVASAASPFPYQYLPDPDSRNWPLPLLTSLSTLSSLTYQGLKNEAIYYTLRHLKRRNGLLDDVRLKDISTEQLESGDFVLREEDVEYAVGKMRRRIERAEKEGRPYDGKGYRVQGGKILGGKSERGLVGAGGGECG